MRPRFRWQLRSRALELGRRTLVMGVLNVTPDSFSDGGRFLEPEPAVEQGLRLLEEGADILDIGGESTRPGARVATAESDLFASQKPVVSAAEELARILPVIEGILSGRSDAVLSVDTYKAVVARAALAAGVEIVNDVSAFQWDAEIATVCAEAGCGVVLMHTRGEPDRWRKQQAVSDITALVTRELGERAQVAMQAGVQRPNIAIDPGLGFGKNFEENYPLLAHLRELHVLGLPLLVGSSRKSFLGRTLSKRLGREIGAGDRLNASLAAMVAAILQGAHIVRVHDVRPAVEAAAVADEILLADENG